MKNKRFLFLLFLAAIVIRLGYLFIFADIYSLPGDDGVYHNFALSFLNGSGWLTTKFFDRMPLYPLFLSIVYFIFDPSILMAKILQTIIFGGGTCILIYYLGKEIFGEKVAKIAGFYSVFYYNLIWMSGRLNCEILFTFLLLLATLYLCRAVKYLIRTHFIFSGIFIALATLTRPMTIIFPFLFFFVFLIYWGKKSLNTALKHLLSFLISLSIVYTPWVVRNYIVFKAFVPTMIEAGYSFYLFNVIIPENIMGREKNFS